MTPVLHDALLVVAHPDDEVLWFSTILTRVRAVLVCFGPVAADAERSRARARLSQSYPLRHVSFLNLQEADVFDCADWRKPRIVEEGLQLDRCDDRRAALYRANFERLHTELRPHVRGCRTVFTHNPWGEYGHEEHVQVHHAVQRLVQESGGELWFPNYCSNRSYRLLQRYIDRIDPDYVERPLDREFAERMKRFYQSHGCWTWYDDYGWFPQECFARLRLPARGSGRAYMPLNAIRMDLPRRDPWRRWRTAARRVLGRSSVS